MSDVLTISGLNKRFGGITVTDDVTLSIPSGQIHALIGPNGAGKTTLLNQIGGQLRPNSGEIFLLGVRVTHLLPAERARLGLARTFQVPRVFGSFAQAQNPAVAAIGSRPRRLGCWTALQNIPELQAVASDALTTAGLTPKPDHAVALSHGERRLLEIAMLLTSQPKIVLLDEPMAGLGHEESKQMVQLLKRLAQRTAIILVEHDMDAVFTLAHRITVLVNGKVIASGSAEYIRGNAQVRQAYLGESHG